MSSLPFPPRHQKAIPPTSRSNSTTSKPRGPRKLRTSCDGCHSAKVKCTKETPACTRCMSLGFCCIYSPSLRAGKNRQIPREGNKKTEPSVRNELDIAGLGWDHGSTTGPELSLDGGVKGLDDIPFGQQGGYSKDSDDFQDFCEAIWRDASAGDASSCLPEDQHGTFIDPALTMSLNSSARPSLSTPYLTSPASPLDLNSFLHDDLDLHGLLSSPLEDISDTERPTNNSTGQKTHEQPARHQSARHQQQQPTPPDSAIPLPAQIPPPLPRCPKITYTGIGPSSKPSNATPDNNNHNPLSWTSTRCFSTLVYGLHTIHRHTDTPSTTLDIILATSKQAVGWCEAVLRCACADESTVIMLLAALVSKILTLYLSGHRQNQDQGRVRNRDRQGGGGNSGRTPAANMDMDMDVDGEGEGNRKSMAGVVRQDSLTSESVPPVPPLSTDSSTSTTTTSTTTSSSSSSSSALSSLSSAPHTDTSPFSPNLTTNPTTNPPYPQTQPTPSTEPLHVTLGAYHPDSEDESRLKTELMLMELRKVDNLLGRFRKRVGMCPVRHESRTYEGLAVSLAKTLRGMAEGLGREREGRGM